ncbi:MAG: hypothetical protein K0Q66_393 [Chitinophagaceae bacterium]|jgi:hypothetical protein|nr:hypothetical protein [Chitinophagaceae bacterium]
MKKLAKRYRELEGPKKWLVYFILNWIYWGFIYGLVYFLITDQPTTIGEYLFMVTFMAFFWTLIYDMFLEPRLRGRKEKKEQ